MVILFSLISSVLFSLPENVEQFIERLHEKDHFSVAQLNQILSTMTPDQSILSIEHQPYEHKTWPVFQEGLVTEKRIEEGVLFFNTNKKVLLQTEKKYHVDPFVITAIIGFESTYGNNAGHYQALNSLYTLGFYYPPREPYFQKQLENLFLLARDWHKPVGTIQSSFDGGLGLPQFMPDMYREIARPYVPNHYPDLINNTNDAIVSVAYYLQQAHWQPNAFIAKPIQYIGQETSPNCQYQKKPTYTIEQLKRSGFVIPNVILQNKVGCVQLQDADHSDYWVIGENFYALQRYNPQIYYVLVVNDLSHAIRESVSKS